MGSRVRSQRWDIDEVASWLVEGARTAHRLPPVRVQGYFNVWPTIVRSDYERMAKDDEPVCRFPPEPAAIDRMMETMRWVQWLEIEQRHLVWMRAERYPWREICKRFGCDRTTAWRRWQVAMSVIVDHLNAGTEGKLTDRREEVS
jgi:hypothetical protein